MNMVISQEAWEEVGSEAHLVTSSNTRREFKWKIIVRFFRTPEIVSKMSQSHAGGIAEHILPIIPIYSGYVPN